jgi:hypothetical protein
VREGFFVDGGQADGELAQEGEQLGGAAVGWEG